MFRAISPHSIVAIATLIPLLLTSGCGGGDGPSSTSQPEPPSAALPDETHAPPSPEAPPPPPATSLPPAPTTPPDSTQAPALTTAVTESIQLAPTYSPLVASTITAAPYWPVWWGTAKPVDGVNCLVNGTFHKHALISIYNNGKRLGFPDGIGRVHAGCYHAYEMHVHDVTGIIHIEADVPKQFKLGQWFSLWQQRLSRDGTAGLPGPVRFYIIENATITRYDGDPYQIELRPHREVLIVTGSTMSVVPKYQWPSGI